MKSLFFPKKQEKSTVNFKAVQTGSYKADVGSGAEAEKNSFGYARIGIRNTAIKTLTDSAGDPKLFVLIRTMIPPLYEVLDLD
jgi:hypothetical protein